MPLELISVSIPWFRFYRVNKKIFIFYFFSFFSVASKCNTNLLAFFHSWKICSQISVMRILWHFCVSYWYSFSILWAGMSNGILWDVSRIPWLIHLNLFFSWGFSSGGVKEDSWSMGSGVLKKIAPTFWFDS